MKRWVPYLIITTIYIVYVLLFESHVLDYRYDPNLIERYFHSQDITHEVDNRIFLSDGDVYQATGYLYAGGSDPSLNNFEHPPVVKYLFGFAMHSVGNPLLVQLVFGYLLLVVSYLTAFRLTKSSFVGFLTVVLLLSDPLFRDTLGQTLLDLGQTFFAYLYLYLMLFRPESWMMQGTVLALFAGSKFWITPMFFIALVAAYRLYKHELKWGFLKHIAISGIVYAGLYTRSFIVTEGHFNLIWHMAKTLKYRLVHNTSTFFGSSLMMYVTSYYYSWWDNSGILRVTTWSLLWPFGLVASIYKAIQKKYVYYALPSLYLLYLGVQAPFPRYFLIILPAVYLAIAHQLSDSIITRRFIPKHFLD